MPTSRQPTNYARSPSARRDNEASGSVTRHDRLAAAAARVVEERCGESLAIADVARDVETSIRTLQRVLARSGMDFSTMIYNARAGRAARLLAEGRSVSDVSLKCGYHSCSHFSTAVFPSWYCMSPTRFCEALRLCYQSSDFVALVDGPYDDVADLGLMRESLDRGGSLSNVLKSLRPDARSRFLRVAAEILYERASGVARCGLP
jgi:AraC-like DNA-binding protein